MTEERVTPLRQRMMEDMRIRGMGDKAQKAHIRAIKDFAAFLGRPPDTATPENLRAYQLHMSDTGVTPSTFNARIVALRFFFGMTCGREEMKRYMQFRTQPRKPPVVFSVGEVSDILMAAPGPGLKYRAALSISYGAGLRAAEVCNLKIGDIVPEARLRHDSDRMLIHVEQGKGRKDRKVMLSPGLLDLLRGAAMSREGRLKPAGPRRSAGMLPLAPNAVTSTHSFIGILLRVCERSWHHAHLQPHPWCNGRPNRLHTFPIEGSKPPAASTLGGFPTRVVVAPVRNVPPRPASENLHLGGHWRLPQRMAAMSSELTFVGSMTAVPEHVRDLCQ